MRPAAPAPALELPDTLARQIELVADRLERPGLTLEAEAKLEDPRSRSGSASRAASAEHPVPIYEDVDRRTRTVSLARAVDRITGAARIELTPSEQRSILKAQKWRDAIVHYEFEMSAYEVEAVFVQLYEFNFSHPTVQAVGRRRRSQ